MKALVLDDKQEDCIEVVAALRQAGYDTVSVTSIGQARRSLEEGSWDLVMLERALPDGTALPFCNEVRERYGEEPIVLFVSDLTTYLLGHAIVPPFMVAFYQSCPLPLLILAVVVAAPVREEVLFRGFLFKGIAASRWGPIAAILISSTIWALIHVQYDPFGIAAVRIGVFALWPFGRTVVRRPDAGAASAIGNVIWFLLAGWWLALLTLVSGIALCLTIIGIPLGLGNFKLIPVTLTPLGREIVDADDPARPSSAPAF